MIKLSFESYKYIISVFFLSFIACGGGSGGTNSSESGVRVLHGSLEAFPVSLYNTNSTERKLLTSSRFGESAGFNKLDSGSNTLVLQPKNSSTQLLRTEIDFENNDRYNLLVYGDRSSFGLRYSLYKENPQFDDLDQETTAVSVAHALIGASSISVSLLPSSSNDIASNIAFGGHSEHVLVPAGVYTVIVTRDADGEEVVRQANVSLLGGEANTLLVAGESGLFSRVITY